MKHYDHTHATVAETFACEVSRGNLLEATRPAERPLYATRLERAHTKATPVAKAAAKPTPGFVAAPAHPNRVKFAHDLIAKRDTDMISIEAVEVMMHLMEGKPVSATEIALLIENLLAAPRKDSKAASNPNRLVHDITSCTVYPCKACAEHTNGTQAKAQGPSLRDLAEPLADKGYYALRDQENPGKIHYYRITRRKGYVKVQEQASDELYPVEYRRSLAVVKALLDSGVEAAQHLYADTLEKCYRCGRTLTDETSRALRIGPDCRAK